MLNLIYSNVELQTIFGVAYRKFLCDTKVIRNRGSLTPSQILSPHRVSSSFSEYVALIRVQIARKTTEL